MDRRMPAGPGSGSPSGPRLDRRGFLCLAAGGLLAACSASPGGNPSPGGATAASPSVTGSPSGAPPQQVPAAEAPTTPPPSPAPPGREQVVARYASVAPTAWGLDVPGVVTTLPTRDRVVALTFDACGGARGSGYDAALVDELRATGTRATLFLNQRWVLAHPEVAAELAADPLFEIANHGTLHRPLSVTGASAYGIPGTAGPGEVYDEVAGNSETLAGLTGAPPRFFRSGTAHYDDVAVRIVGELGEVVVNFDVNGDAGATAGPEQVASALLSAAPGSIVLCHMNQPAGGTARGVAAALPRLAAAGFRFVHLSDHLG